jgi:hypothetical protein
MVDGKELAALAAEVARLRRQSRIWRAGLALALAAFVSAGARWSRPPVEEVVRTRRVVLFDERSTPRLDLYLSSKGPVVSFRDSRGKEFGSLSVAEEAAASGEGAVPKLLLLDPAGQVRWSAP